jgi:hypothetical protein
MIKRVGILTGGGDCSGLNPTIRGAVYRAQDYNYEVYGIQEGWKGLVKGNLSPLNLSEVKEIVDRGGTILGILWVWLADYLKRKVLNWLVLPRLWIMILAGLTIPLVSIVQLPGQLRRCEAFKTVDDLIAG